eukprot:TRINITY_DN3467_c0_g2_i1.p1 TRINITY_DN3467_c0_g2~~TRINITY_DN3467_c0_g2_i1.p1  ORF type:complete len:978 (-),score=326.85 TRINITY_DN3467_c0_g2_i1:18-2951(-)
MEVEEKFICSVRAKHDFRGTMDDNLNFRRGEILYVVHQDPTGWWIAQNQAGDFGLIPSNHVEIIQTFSTDDGKPASSLGFVLDDDAFATPTKGIRYPKEFASSVRESQMKKKKELMQSLGFDDDDIDDDDLEDDEFDDDDDDDDGEEYDEGAKAGSAGASANIRPSREGSKKAKEEPSVKEVPTKRGSSTSTTSKTQPPPPSSSSTSSSRSLSQQARSSGPTTSAHKNEKKVGSRASGDADQDNFELQVQLRKVEERERLLRAQIERLQKENEKKDNELADLRQDVKSLSVEADESDKFQFVWNENSKLKQELSALRERIFQLEKEKEEYQAGLVEKKRKSTEIEEGGHPKKRDSRKRSSSSEAVNPEEILKLQKKLETLLKYEKDVEHAHGTIKTLSNEIAGIRSQLKDREAELASVTKEREMSETTHKELRMEIIALEERLHGVEEERDDLRRALVSSSGNESKAKEQYEKKEKEINEWKKKCVRFEGESKRLRSQVAEIQAMLDEASRKHGDADDQLSRLHREMKDLIDENASQKEEIHRWKSASLTAKSNGKAIRQRWQQRTRKMAEDVKIFLRHVRKMMADMRSVTSECIGGVPAAVADLRTAISTLSKRPKDLLVRYQRELAERRRLFNIVQELRGNIRVMCRIRPFLDEEESDEVVRVVDEYSLTVSDKVRKKTHEFEYDHIFGSDSTHDDIFDQVRDLATSVLDGYNASIFAYGQTGSGKTYTMEPLYRDCLRELFHVMEGRDNFEFSLGVSVLEIYNENVFDLLGSKPRERKLDIKIAGPEGVRVPELTIAECTSFDAILGVLERGHKNRAVGKTNMNEYSSRSHLVLSVVVVGAEKETGKQWKGKLHLVDLAGSERVKRSEATGDRLVEAQNINRSLSALGDVISALTSTSKRGGDVTAHIPYRNSKLTTLLQDSLGGDAKTLMFVMVSPGSANFGESIASLNFALRVRNVENDPRKHVGIGAVAKE